MSGQRILILGATGFIGSHVRRALAEEPHNQWTSVARAAPSPPPLSSQEKWIVFDGERARTSDLGRLLRSERPSVVINCAGSTTGGAVAHVEANVLLTAVLLDAIEGLSFGVRLVHIGSAAEYGPVASRVALNETAPCRPASIYGITKLAATELIVEARRRASVDAVVVRLFNPIGRGMPVHTLPGRASQLLRDAVAVGAREIRLGSLDAWRDYIDVREAARALVAAAHAPGFGSETILNVGAGRAMQTRELVGRLSDVAGFTGTIVEDAPPSDRSASVAWQAADITRARELLGWSPDASIDAALRALWEGEHAAAAPG